MALSITNILAASHDAVAASEAVNQWAENAALKYMDKKGFIKRMDLGATIEVPLDYLVNSAAEFLATDITATSLSKTAILGAASYAVAEVSVPMVWTKKDEATNPSQNQKVAYVKTLIKNGRTSHDNVLETGIFAATATNGFLSLPVLAVNDGTGTIGGIVSGTDTMWKNQFKDYTDASALLADLDTLFSACAKGSGGAAPTAVFTTAAGHGVYVGKLVANQRFEDANADGGFPVVKFNGADVIYSHRAPADKFFMASPESLQLIVSKSAFRQRGETREVDAANAFVSKLYSAVQLITPVRSRLGVAFT